jgi:DNA gyrase subunit B
VSKDTKQLEEDIALGLISPEQLPEEPKKSRKKKKLSQYVFNDFELEKFRKNTNYKITGIQRYKGLGEMDAQQLWETTLDPESRILAQISISDTVDADAITTTLMSSNVPPRREFIMEEAKYANLDV